MVCGHPSGRNARPTCGRTRDWRCLDSRSSITPSWQFGSMNGPLHTQPMIMVLSFLGMLSGLVGIGAAESGAAPSGRWAIALHGGAGRIARDLDQKER